MEDKEIKDTLKAMGGDWAIVEEFEKVVNIIDNDLFRKFASLSWIIEDDKTDEAIRAYLFKQDILRFKDDEDLHNYLSKRTMEKYGKE